MNCDALPTNMMAYTVDFPLRKGFRSKCCYAPGVRVGRAGFDFLAESGT